jgi:hypothetical protein
MIHLLWFVREKAAGEDSELLLGVYSSEAAAKAAVQRLRGKPGFVAYPEGFQIHPYELDVDHWTDGFIID